MINHVDAMNMISALAEAGYLIAWFSPSEAQGHDREHLLDAMYDAAQDIIEREPEEEGFCMYPDNEQTTGVIRGVT